MNRLLPLALLLSGCGQSAAPAAAEQDASAAVAAVGEARDDVSAVAEPAMEQVQVAAASVVAPAVVDVRELVQQVVPPAAAAVPVSPAAVDLIVRYEVTGESHYTRRLQWPIWPGGASGVTWGIGYDGGHQTRAQIGVDWSAHAAVERLLGTSGVTGKPASALAGALQDVVTPFGYASDVFAAASLPSYLGQTRRAYGAQAIDALPPDAAGALVSNTYNRGASMLGARNAEKRAIRDRCLPAQDLACIAAQLRAQCRLWEGTPNGRGLCNRREDEARLAEGAR